MQTKELLRAFKNIIKLCKYAKAIEAKDFMPSVLIAPQSPSPDAPGSLLIIGASSHIVAIEEIDIVNSTPFSAEDVDVLIANTVKTDVIDDLEKTHKAISGTSKSKDATVTLVINQGHSVAFSSGDTLLSELEAHGLERTWFEAVLNWVDSQPTEMQAPLMLDAGIISRFKDVRPRNGLNRPPNIDIVGISDHPSGQAFIYKVGETLTGVYRAVDRESFATGGPWHDGAGNNASLIQQKAK